MWIWIIIIISSIWVYLDAKNLGMGKRLKYTIEDLNRMDKAEAEFDVDVSKKSETGPLGWAFASLLIWIIAFPAYLYSRYKFKQKIKVSSEKICPFCAEKIKAAAIVCKHCGKSVGK